MTRSAPSNIRSNDRASSTISMPGQSRAPSSAYIPPPAPPAAPAPGNVPMSVPLYARMASAKRASPASSRSTIAASAPFWGAKIWAAPRSPKKGLFTSQATCISVSRRATMHAEPSMRATRPVEVPRPGRMLPASSKNRYPRAVSKPIPPSFVALPPIPTRILRQPCRNASAIICPVP